MNNELLVSLFSSGDDFQYVRKTLDRRAQPGRRKSTRVTGLCDGTKPLFCAALAASVHRTLILCPDDPEAKRLADFIASVGQDCAFYPVRDYNFNNITASHDFEHERLSVLWSMMTNDNFTVVTTPAAALSVTITPEKLAALTVELHRDSEIDTDELTDRLTACGYRRSEMVEARGQFAVRGGIIDIYPPQGDPIRIELFGDEVDRMGHFSAESQRFLGDDVDSVSIIPAVENVISEYERGLIRTAVTKQIAKVRGTAAETVLRSELDALDNSGTVDFADKYLPVISPEAVCLLDYADEIIVLSESRCRERADAAFLLVDQSITDMKQTGELAKASGVYMRDFTDIDTAASNTPVLFEDTFAHGATESTVDFRTRHIPAYDGNYQRLTEDISAFSTGKVLTCILCATSSEAKQITDALMTDGRTVMNGDSLTSADDLPLSGARLPVIVTSGEYFAGFGLESPKFALLDYSSSSRRSSLAVRMKKRRRLAGMKKDSTEAIMSYADLNVGDYVVHASYGIGQYMGIENLTVAGVSRDYVHIDYAGSQKLYLPTDQLDLVSKYIGASSESDTVKLSRMGGADWKNAKARAKKASQDMAKELIELYARRQRTQGIAFDPDSDMSAEFADAFEYEETDGQLQAVEDITNDMEKPCPMDRLLCGDVGYGKTEVALRAAFKAVMSGYQVAILVPTTILALQHYQTMLSRMRNFPVSVDMVSRFRSKKAQEATLRKLKRGELDIIVGTHRLISNDVEFANLGLLIIDEEQRFGVAQKEKLKKLATNADVLTLTATPIPRTLNMAMGGIVDMSVLEEAPGMRTPVQTYVMEYDEPIITEALRRELRRGGQTFYLINYIEKLYQTASHLEKLLPDAQIAVAHGQMDRDDLEDIWASLVRGEIDILVSTTIIETGVDVPNANTLIIENADRYGLSQLHQIRGRVGRSTRRAYAYFTYMPNKSLTDIAEKRLAAIREYAAFGAGFRIALRDLEIRGAGNLLGAEQHGHLDAVGYDMYIRLLNEAVLEEKGEALPKPRECTVDIKLDAFLAKSYIPSGAQRMEMYKKIARITSEADFEDILDELCDRFGEPPRAAVNLCRIARLRGAGLTAGIKKITQIDDTLRLVPDSFDPAVWQTLSGYLQKGSMRVTLSPEPAATVKLPKGSNPVEFGVTLLKKYIQIQSESETDE